MPDSLNKLWLKGKAEEDIYIAKCESEMRKKKLRKQCQDADKKRSVKIGNKSGRGV